MRYDPMRSALLAILLVAPSLGPAQSVMERAENDQLVFMGDEEPAMRRAFQVARESLDSFLETAQRAAPEHTGFALKVAISQGKQTEYFWVTNFESKDGK